MRNLSQLECDRDRFYTKNIEYLKTSKRRLIKGISIYVMLIYNSSKQFWRYNEIYFFKYESFAKKIIIVAITACSSILSNFWVLQQKVKESISSGTENCLDWTWDRHSWYRASAPVILPETNLKGAKHCCPNTAARSANNHHNNGNSTAVLWCLIILACAKYILE